jgi:beta-N-acetylhexosaminidase
MANHRVSAVGEQTSLADRKRRAGQRLILGFAGPKVDDDLKALVREIRPAGFILFKRNIEDPEQVRELNRELASLVEPANPAFLSVDQEGGRVQRIRAPATVWPPMRVVGRAQERVEDVSRALAREVRAMGFNLNFAPVADVDSNPDNPVIGDRSFGRDPDEVAKRVATFIAAHQGEGVIACAKHFPGHGDTSVDSHLELPVVERDEPDLRRLELVPFIRAAAAGVGAVMTSHVVYPAWDEQWPATLSPRIIRGILREEIGYPGVVISDDLEMKAVRGRYPLSAQIRQSTLATVDLLLCCESPELQIEAFGELVRIQEEDRGLQQCCIDSVGRINGLREAYFHSKTPLPGLEVVGCASHRDLSTEIEARLS